ncbi:MAG: type II toxin-antitoxin system VapC family toxin [Akkermansiaceae bacterium]|nr:type II toxin-antitoxin system VapC family toxin [Akkermansiaceae bacterium]
MVIGADTSFLFSLYSSDSHTPRALAWCRANTSPIHISVLNRFELLNALRFAECRKTLPPGQSSSSEALFENAIRQERLIETPANLADILAEASRLSAAHTVTGGHRGFDILHVAAVRIMGATRFLTFDANQKRLAQNEGLTVPV